MEKNGKDHQDPCQSYKPRNDHCSQTIDKDFYGIKRRGYKKLHSENPTLLSRFAKSRNFRVLHLTPFWQVNVVLLLQSRTDIHSIFSIRCYILSYKPISYVGFI